MPKAARHLIVLFAMLTAPARAADLPDYFAPHAGMDVGTALYLDAWSGRARDVNALRALLDTNPPPSNAADGWSFLCNFDYQTGRYDKSEDECAKAVALDPQGGDVNTLAIVKLVVHQPATHAMGSARVPVSAGAHISVAAGDYHGTAIADTGAEIAVMMQSVAVSAHVKILGASGNVGSTTASITGQIGLIPQVKIGEAVIRNVPVLVLPDAQLTVTDGKQTVLLTFILSLYALADFGRIAWVDHGKTLALGSAAPISFSGAVPMIWHPKGIAIPLDGPGGRHAAHFDSGDDISYLFDAALPLLSEGEQAQIAESKRKIGGAGGVVEETVRKLPTASFTLAGQPLVLRNVNVAKEPKSGEAARLGEDVLQIYSAVAFDFGAMAFSVSP